MTPASAPEDALGALEAGGTTNGAAAGTDRGRAPARAAARPSDFDLADLAPANAFRSAAIRAAFDAPQRLWAVLRTCLPTFRAGGLLFVLRAEDVREVLENHDAFHTPFEDKTRTLNGPETWQNFVLGMQDGADYRALHDEVMAAFPRSDVAATVSTLAADHAQAIVAAQERTFDAVEGLITLSATRIVRDYFGVDIPPEEETAFGHWTIAMNNWLFGDPSDNWRYRRAAKAGAGALAARVDASIATGGRPGTVIERLVNTPGMTDERRRVHIVGMIVGFVPTNTMAAGHILDMLLRRPAMMRAACDAVQARDDARLGRALFEAMRFKPLNPGPFRVCARDYTIAAGTWRARRVLAGTKLLVGTHSAMFDGRQVDRPHLYDIDRAPGIYMLFGHGLHWCTGIYIAEAHVVQTFKALLAWGPVRRAAGADGRITRIGPFPRHLAVTLPSDASTARSGA